MHMLTLLSVNEILLLRDVKWSTNFPSCSHVSTILWLPHMDFNKALRQKVRWELHKDVVCCFEQILEAAPHKTAAVWPFASHLSNNPNKTNKTC